MDRTLRILGAVLVLANGAIHLARWSDSYQNIPTIGGLFLVNAAAAVVIAVALVARPSRLVEGAAVAFSIGTLTALALATADMLFEFRETTGDAYVQAAVVVEAAAVVVIGFALARRLLADGVTARFGRVRRRNLDVTAAG